MRVKDLWISEVNDPDAPPRQPGEPVRKIKVKSARHPDNGGNPDAKRWLAIWRGPDGKEKSKAFAVKTVAAAHAKRMDADVARDEYIEPKAARELFGAVVLRYIQLRDIGGTTRNRYLSIYRHHVEPIFGGRPVADIKASDIAKWLKGAAAELSPGVRETAYLMIAGAFELAVDDRQRRDNPARAKSVAKPRVGKAEREAWTVERVWLIRDELPEPYRPLLDCLAGLGLRRGCGFALADDDFDFEAGKVRVRRQVSRVGRRIVFKLPKGGKERVVPLPLGVAASVRAHMAKYPPTEVSLPWMEEKADEPGDPVTVRLVFTWAERGHKTVTAQCLQNGNFYQDVWKPALSRLGIIPPPERGSHRALVYKIGDGGEHNGMHAPRHVYNQMLDDGGVSLAGMMEFMGHSRKGRGITIGVYGHVTEETFERARNAVDQRLFKLRTVASDRTVTELRRAR
jgi:integrase